MKKLDIFGISLMGSFFSSPFIDLVFGNPYGVLWAIFTCFYGFPLYLFLMVREIPKGDNEKNVC